MDTTRERINILLVDDDEDEYILLKTLVSNGGVKKEALKVDLEWAPTFESALKAFETGKHDAYLVDVNLGRHNGLELLRAASELDIRAPIIILTGQGTYENDISAMQGGASDFLEKDKLNLPLLERSIRYAIENKQAQEVLEERVRERTDQLARANEELIAEISLRRQAENYLRESEMKFRALADTTSAAIFIVQENIIRYANPASQFILGYEPLELIDHPLDEFVHPSYRDTINRSEANIPWAPNIPVRYEIKVIRKDGGERWVDVTSGEITYEGKPAWVITAFDITERDLAEQELRKAKLDLERRVEERTSELRKAVEQLHTAATEASQRAEELEALNNATQALLSTLDLETLLTQILDAAQSAIPAAEKGWLYLVEPKTGQLTIRAASDERIRNIRLPKGGKYPFKSFNHRKPVRIGDTHQEEALLSSATDINIDTYLSAMIAPLLLEDEIIGVMALGSSKIDSFTEEDLHLLTSFSITATSAIRNAILHTEMQRLAITDGLTGRYNRRAFMEMGEREIERARRFMRPLVAVMIDIDNFKQINDQYGHAAGDVVLKSVSDRILSCIRDVDILARYGGDEFAILLPESEWLNIFEISRRISACIVNEPIKAEGNSLAITISLGAARAKGSDDQLEKLLARADAAMYRAKQSGKNRIEICND